MKTYRFVWRALRFKARHRWKDISKENPSASDNYMVKLRGCVTPEILPWTDGSFWQNGHIRLAPELIKCWTHIPPEEEV